MRQRWIQALVLAVVAVAGILAYGKVVRPDRSLLGRLAADRLREIFGPDVSYDSVRIDLVTGVEVRGLKVRTPATIEPTLLAERVEVRHDVLALASGAYRPETIVIEKARIVTRETESGIAPDFPFHLEAGDAPGPLPRLVVVDATLFYRAMPGSQRLREQYVLVLDDVDLAVAADPAGTLQVKGSFRTRGLDQDEVRITLDGTADPAADALRLVTVWEPFRLTPHVLDHVLAEPVSSVLRGRSLDEGRLQVTLLRDPGEGAGELRVSVLWEGEVQMGVATEIPGAERIDARTKEQLQALLGPGKLTFEVTPEGIDIKGLATALGGGQVEATGRIEDEGEVVHISMRVRGLRLEDPSIRKALGEEGAAIFDQFQATGRVDADVRVVKERGKPLDFTVNAILEGASFRYVGAKQPDGTYAGFPYRVVDASGTVRITPGRVEFGDIVGVGAHTRASFRLRGSRREAWAGGETGRILVTDKGPDMRLTVEGTAVPVDRDMEEAVAGSEFAGLLDTYRLAGVVDRIEVDVIAVPGVDSAAVTEVRVSLEDESFRYAKFPLDLEHVSGWVTMRRPILDTGRRGRVFAFDVQGTAEGAPARVSAEFRQHEDRGRLQVRAEAVPLAGALTKAVLGAPATKDGLGAVWRFLDPRGRADLDGSFPLESDPDPVRLTIGLRDASVRLDAERAETPVEVTDLTGYLRVNDDVVQVAEVRGRLGDAAVRIDGVVEGGPAGRWDLVLDTDVLRLTAPLLAEMARLSAGESLLPEGLRLEPDGRMALNLHLRRDRGTASTLRADVVARKIDASLALPGGTVIALRGEVMDLRDDRVSVEELVAEAAGVTLRARKATIDERGLKGTFELALDRFEPTKEVWDLVPEEVRADLEPYFADRLLTTKRMDVHTPEEGGVVLRGELTLVGRPNAAAGTAPLGTLSLEPLVVSPATARGRTLRGDVRFQGLSFDPGLALEGVFGLLRLRDLTVGPDPGGTGSVEGLAGKIAGVSVKDVSAPVTWSEGILTLDPLAGSVSGGRLTGRLRVHTRDPSAYEGWARIDAFRLEQLREDLAPSGPPYAGTGHAEVRFENRGTGLRDLTAAGRVQIRDGNLGDLPAVANIFALLGGVLPVKDPPKFERADVEFTLRDEVVRFQRLELGGPLFDMPGRGSIDLSGTVDVTFTPDFLKSMALPGVMQLPVIGDVLGGVLREELLYAVRVRGDMSTARPELVFLPPLGLSDRRTFVGTGVPEPLPRPVPRWFR